MAVSCLSEVKSLAGSIKEASAVSEESTQLINFIRALKKSKPSMSASAYHEDIDVSIYNISPIWMTIQI